MLRTIVPAADWPVSLAEAKDHLNVDYDDKDELVAALIGAATLWAEAVTARRFVEQTVEWILPHWPRVIRLPVAPVRASDGIVSIKYYDAADALQTLPASDYVVRQDGETVCIVPLAGLVWPPLSTTPAAEPVVVRFVVGHPTDASPPGVPDNVKAAIKLHVEAHFDRGDDMEKLIAAAQALLLQEVWS